MSISYIGIGSNLGNREDNCRSAVNALARHGISVLKASSVIETDPWGIEDQPRFLNMAVQAETIMDPDVLLQHLKHIEEEIGRAPSVRWGPRAIDLDILFFDSLILKKPGLEIPHPGIAEREFVLLPLSEIAPDLMHPVLQKSVGEMLRELSLPGS